VDKLGKGGSKKGRGSVLLLGCRENGGACKENITPKKVGGGETSITGGEEKAPSNFVVPSKKET